MLEAKLYVRYRGMKLLLGKQGLSHTIVYK